MEPQQSAPQNNPDQGVVMPQPQPVAVTPPPQPQVQPQVVPTPPPPNYQPPPAAKKRRIPIWLKIIGVVVIVFILLIIGVGILAGQVTKNAVKVSNQFVADMQANNDSAAYALITPAFKQVDTEDEFAETISSVYPVIQGKATVTGREINKVSGQPNEAIVVYSIKTSTGTEYLRVVLQDNNPWQVLNFRSSDTPLSDTSTD